MVRLLAPCQCYPRYAIPTMKHLFALVVFTLVAQAQPNQPGTQWTDDQLRQTVDVARVGRRLTPKSWPNGAHAAVALTFDTDSEAPLLRDGTTSPTTLSASD